MSNSFLSPSKSIRTGSGVKYAWLIALSLVISACDSGGSEPDPDIGTLPPAGDADNDGLENQLEIDGWTIDIDSLGYGLSQIDKLETRHVTSDPELTDTDDDGLSDDEERAANTDPSRKDTDGDGLNDYDELRVYKSSPSSKDTDGDATSLTSSIPNANLFDGEEVKTLLTSPLDEDTDGDGLTDLVELTNGGATRALISDVPDISLNVYSNPSITYNGTVTASDGTVKDVGTTFTAGTSSSTTHGRSNTRSTATVISKSHTEGGSVSGGFPWSASVEGHYDQTSSKSSTNGMESTSSFDQTRSAEMSQQLSNDLSLSSNREITYTGGEVIINFDLANEGELPIELSEVEISAFQFKGGDLVPVGQLLPQSATPNPTWSMGVTSSSQGNIAKMTLDSPEVIGNLLKNQSGLLFRVAKYKMTSLTTPPVDYIVQDSLVKQHTGKLIIDYGQGNVKTYNIATNVKRDPDTNTPLGVTLKEIFGPKMLNLQYKTDSSSETGFNVLTGLQLATGNPAMREITSDLKDGFWAIISELGVSVNDKNVEDIILNQGDQISLLFVRDQDQDGLYEREEKLLGTDDLLADTDGDGLTDFEETRTGWNVPFYALGNTVYPDPRIIDTDEDGVDDAAEKLAETDPRNPDTDSDGFSDLADDDPLVPATYVLVDSYNWAGRTISYSNIRVNGGTSRQVTVSPGASVQFTTDWSLSVAGVTYCPGCIVQFYTGIQNVGETCLISRGMNNGVTDTGSDNFTFTAPTEPGVYLINTKISLQYECVDVNVGVDPNNALAIITVQ